MHVCVHACVYEPMHARTCTHTHTAPKFYLGSITSWVLCRYAFCSEHKRDLLDQLLQNEPLTEVLPSEHCNMTHICLLMISSSMEGGHNIIQPLGNTSRRLVLSVAKSQHRSMLSHELCRLMESCWTDKSNNIKHNSHLTENPSIDESKRVFSCLH